MKTIILIHGRGSSAEDILVLSKFFPGHRYIAPIAPGGTWYPYSFLSPVEMNEPFLIGSLSIIGKSVTMDKSQIVLMGFSQGACLALEFAARNPGLYGGVIAFSGALITYGHRGDFSGTPVFIGCSEKDPHIPIEKVNETEKLFSANGAMVTKYIYKGFSHTITKEEIEKARKIIEQ